MADDDRDDKNQKTPQQHRDDFWQRLDGINAGMLGVTDDLNLVPMSHTADRDQMALWFITAEGVNLVEQQGYADCLGLLETGGVDAITTDDIILAGLAATEANKGKFKVVGAPFSEEPYGVGLNKENDKCEDINTAIKKMIDEGEGEKALNANTEGTGYKPNAELNPPTEFEACS